MTSKEKDFVCFLLENKYDTTQESLQDDLKFQELLDSAPSNMSGEGTEEWIEKVEGFLPVRDKIQKDVLFGVLYSITGFAKRVKEKNFPFKKVSELYQGQFQENKKHLMDYNKKSKSKLDLTEAKRETTRFPPEPSGYLHIGHAKAALLNKTMAMDGRLVVRMDDTNPEKESSVFEKAILEDLKLLKIDSYDLTHSSDYFDKLFEYAIKLIEKGLAYVDNTKKEDMQRERTEGIASKNRDLDPEESKRIFLEMKKGEHKEYCLRAKISVDNPNKALRDPVIFRSSTKSHPRTGDKYKIYPTYDFTVPIVDSLEGITLALRTNEYRDRNGIYFWIIDSLELPNKPRIMDFSRLSFDNTVVSKRSMKFYVDNGYVDGWDDPRLCTLRGLRRSGMHSDALIEYILMQGASQKTAVNSWDKIWAMNKRVIDPLSPRYSAIPKEYAVNCFVKGASEESAEVLVNKKYPEIGKKMVIYSSEILISQEDARVIKEGEEITLMNWGNAIVEEKKTKNDIVTSIALQLYLEGDFKKTKNKINWISVKGATQIQINEYSSLQNDVVSDNLAEKFNKNSKTTAWWLAEPGVGSLKEANYVQFERIGFFFCDKPYEFNLIPYTKQKRVDKV